jgi:hypothetical protein
MLPEGVEHCPGRHLPDLDGFVLAACGQQPAIGIPSSWPEKLPRSLPSTDRRRATGVQQHDRGGEDHDPGRLAIGSLLK